MNGWQGFVALVVVVLVVIAPRQTLVPTLWWTRRLVGVGLVAVVALSVGSYLLLRGGLTEQETWQAWGSLGLGGACAAWWIYRRFVPRYREQEREADEAA